MLEYPLQLFILPLLAFFVIYLHVLYFIIIYGSLEALLTGDAEKRAEYTDKKYNVDILQVPYHGSKNS